MDITNNTSTSTSSWDLDMSMGNQLLLDHQNLFEFGPPLDTFQAHLNMPPQFTGTQMPNPRDVEGQHYHEEEEGLGAMKEMMYKIAAMQPVDIDPSTIKKPKRRNVRISDDPQSIAARHRREKISERIRILQRLVPGGTKMDTASMLDEAIRYVKFLKRQVQELQGTPPVVTAHVGVVGGHPAGPPEWLLMRPDSHGSSSSSSSMGAPAAGLGFHFSSDRMC